MRTSFFVFLFFLCPVLAVAGGKDWRVAKTTAQVRYSIDHAQWVDLRAGDIVANGATIATGPRGRVQLVRGVENVILQPNTVASFSTSGLLSPTTEIVQRIGSLDLQIEKRERPHTTVQTPYLAAVVKGTVFHVSVGRSNASVTVDRGLVQVTSFRSGQQSNVGPGQSATVGKRGMSVAGSLSKPAIARVPPSVAKVSELKEKEPSSVKTNSKKRQSDDASAAGADTSGRNHGKSAGSSGGAGQSSSGGNGSGRSGNGQGASSGNGNASGADGGNRRGNGNGGNRNSSGNNGNSGNGNNGKGHKN